MASQQVSSVLASLGIQDAAGKQRLPGLIVNMSKDKIYVLATPRKKWTKLKAILIWLKEELKTPEAMNHKLLKQKFFWGFTQFKPAQL